MPPVVSMPRTPLVAKANPDQMSAPPSPVRKSSWETPIPISIPPRRTAPIVLRSPMRARRTRRSISSRVYPSSVRGGLGVTFTPPGSSFSCSVGSWGAGSDEGEGSGRTGSGVVPASSACAPTLRGEANSAATTHINPSKYRMTNSPLAPAPLRQLTQCKLGRHGTRSYT